MLIEALEYLATPCPADARALGYLSEAVALGARHRRQRRAWARHVAAARDFVRDAAAQAPAGGRILVAGSGRLIEVPLDDLARRFATVVLADLVHPWTTRVEAARYRNVRLATADVSEYLGPLRRALASHAPPPEPPVPTGLSGAGPDLPGFDLVVSCNLLSQLPLLPLEALARRRPSLPQAERDRLAHGLVAAHVRWLTDIAPVAALFSDTDSRWIDRSGAVVGHESSLWGTAMPAPDRSWLWTIAPAPEQDSDLDLHHTVSGWMNLNAPPGQSQPPPSSPPP